MTAKQLTDSILQMAIQGKLVPQDPNDEPASVLLEHIREEKKRMVKEKSLKKTALAETEINADDIPFDIPESWVWTTVSNIFTINPKVNGEDDDNAAFIPMEKIDAGYSSSFTYEVKKWKEIKSSYTNFANGDVAFAKITPCFQNRKSVIFCNLPNGIGAGTTELKVLRQYGETIDRKYLLYFLKSPYFINEAKFKGTANQQRIVIGYLENKYFPLPPLTEQHRIVKRIEEFLPVIKEYGEAYDEASMMDAYLPDKLKKSILQEAIMGKLGTQDPNDEPAKCLLEDIRAEKQKLVEDKILKKKDLVETPVEDDEVPFNIPETWEWVKIDTLFQHSSGKQLKGGDNEGELHQYITTSNLYWDKFILDNLKSMYYKSSELDKCTAIKGDLLVCEGGDVGRCAIWPYDYNICLQNHVHRLRPYYNICTRLVMYILMLYKAKGYIGGKGIGIKGLSASALKNYCIPLPPLAEQHRIVKKIEELYAEIDNMTVENNINIKEIEVTDNE